MDRSEMIEVPYDYAVKVHSVAYFYGNWKTFYEKAHRGQEEQNTFELWKQGVWHLLLPKSIVEPRRPWGYYEVLYSSRHLTIKRITVFSHSRNSLQRHQLRKEHWYVEGQYGECASLLLSREVTADGDIETVRQEVGDAPFIILPKLLHRFENDTDYTVTLIEISEGTFKEDDIERVEDDYGRIGHESKVP
jgi:mannose-6-phosphate isomerase-like protein (cupin superfamily)